MGTKPDHKPTDELRAYVRRAARANTQDNIAACMEISVRTLQRYYSEEYNFGKAHAIAEVGENLLSRALKGYTAESIFYLKTQGGWTQRLEVTGKDGGPIQTVDLAMALAGKTEDELRILEQFLVALLAQGGISVPANDPILLESSAASEGAG